MVWTELRYLVLLPALAPLAYYCLAIFSSWDYFRRIRKLPPIEPHLSPIPPVSILKPVRGVDREVYDNFAWVGRKAPRRGQFGVFIFACIVARVLLVTRPGGGCEKWRDTLDAAGSWG